MTATGRRNAVRKPVRGSGEAAEIEIGGKRIPVLLMNVSVRGAGAVAINFPQAQDGKEVVLHRKLRSRPCRIVTVGEAGLDGGSVHRVGLEFIED